MIRRTCRPRCVFFLPANECVIIFLSRYVSAFRCYLDPVDTRSPRLGIWECWVLGQRSISCSYTAYETRRLYARVWSRRVRFCTDCRRVRNRAENPRVTFAARACSSNCARHKIGSPSPLHTRLDTCR